MGDGEATINTETGDTVTDDQTVGKQQTNPGIRIVDLPLPSPCPSSPVARPGASSA